MRVDLMYHGKPHWTTDTRSPDGKYFAHYSKFYIGDEDSGFTLHLGGYSGTAGDEMSWNNRMMFSTKENDRDITSRANCARERHGAWWYDNCGGSNLNGKWGGSSRDGVYWTSLTGFNSMTFSEMKLRLL